MQDRTLTILARLGYAARGVVYLVIGGLAVQAALGSGGRTTDSKGALREVLAQPMGQSLLGLVAAGLVGYAVWRFVQGYADADGHGSELKGLAIRAGLLGSAISHALLAVYAIALVIGSGGSASSGGASTEAWTAQLLAQPFGQWLVGIAGATVIGVGVAHMIKAWKTRFERYLAMSPSQMALGRPVAVFGLVARGLVFVIIGSFLIVAAYQADPQEAKSLGEMLTDLRQQSYGPWLLGVVALGLFAFGIYSCMEAVFRRVGRTRPPVSAPTAVRSA